MAGVVPANPKIQFFSSTGAPLATGTVDVYLAGTVTRSNTWSDLAQSTLNANPIVLNSRGEGSVYLDGALTYKFVLKNSAGVEQYTVDNISGVGALTAVTFLQAGTGAVARTAQAKMRDVISVKDFGAAGDGVADDTAEIQAAIDSLTSGKGTVFFPKGTYKVTSTLSVILDRIHLVGEGAWATEIQFVPAAADICIFIGKGGEGATDSGVITQCSVRGLTFTSTDQTFKKTAIEVKDGSFCRFEDLVVGSTTQWIGAGSTGIRTRGREGMVFRDLYLAADQPVIIGLNTSATSLCADQFRFENITTICRGHLLATPVHTYANFKCEPGVNLTNVTVGGFQSWNRGKYGFQFDNASLAATASSYAISFENVRWEGEPGDEDTGYAFYFDQGSVSDIQSMTIRNCYIGEIGQGYYFRNFLDITLQNCQWISTSLKALDVDTVGGDETLKIINCRWATGSTASIGTAFYLYDALLTNNSSPVVRSGEYSSSTSRRDLTTGGALKETSITVAATDPTVVTLPLSSGASVVVILTDSRGKFAIVGVNTVAKTTTLIYDDGTWSVTLDTASKLNVYWDAGSSTYKVQNKTGVSRTLYLQSLGSNQ